MMQLTEKTLSKSEKLVLQLTEDKPTSGILSLSRGLRILELLSNENGPRTLTQISQEMGINKSISLRLLDELCNCGFVYHNKDRSIYELTYKMNNLGLRKLAQTRLLDQSQGILRELANQTGELVRLAIVEPENRLTWILAFVGARRTLHIDPNYALEISLNTHAVGKAWLSSFELEKAIGILQEVGIEKMTRHSKVDLDELRLDLKKAKQLGFATSHEENELGVRAIAAPIMVNFPKKEIHCVGVVSVAAPVTRASKKEIEQMSPKLLQAVKHLSNIWPIDQHLYSSTL